MAPQTAELRIEKVKQENNPDLRKRAIALARDGKEAEEIALILNEEFPLITKPRAKFIILGAMKLIGK